MTDRRVLIFGEGPHEIGGRMDAELSCEELPALPRLVRRLAGEPKRAGYVCCRFKEVRAVHGKGANKFAKKVIRAMRQAERGGFHGAVIVIDRDRQPDRERIGALRQGRDVADDAGCPPCAVGTAVETFDAWMIADADGIKTAGGDPTKAPPNPESLDAKAGPRHPKDVAHDVFGAAEGSGLGEKYAHVAREADLTTLERNCPKSFAPFAKEVRERIAPALR